MSESTTVSVRILDKEYQVSCPPEEVDELTGAARFLDERMREIRETGKVFGLDRIAVMAALNIAHEFLGLKTGHSAAAAGADGELGDLTDRVINVLAEQKRLNA